MEDKFEQARKILLHPNFKKLSPTQIQDVYKTLLASGLTKSDIMAIIRSSTPKQKTNLTYLEYLPYNVLVNLVMTGNIEGKDLISLCVSSPLINEKCNKAFNAEGKVIPQYLFYLLLKKMGFPLEGITNYRDFYVRYSQEKVFNSFNEKLQQLKKLLKQESDSSKDLHTLFYSMRRDGLHLIISDPLVGGIKYMDLPQQVRIFYDQADNVIYELKNLEEYFRQNGLSEDALPRGTIVNLDIFLEIIGISKENFLNYGAPFYILSGILSHQNLEHLSNAQEFFREALNMLLEEAYVTIENTGGVVNTRDLIKETIRNNWNKLVNIGLRKAEEERRFTIAIPEEVLRREQDERDLEAILTGIAPSRRTLPTTLRVPNNIPPLTEEELGYLADLHEKVVLGKLPVLTSLKFEELIKY
jgi:hypothetical protein